MRLLIIPPKGKDIAKKYIHEITHINETECKVTEITDKDVYYTTPDGEEHVYPVELTKFTILC